MTQILTNDNVAEADVTLLLPGLLAGSRQPHPLEEYPLIDRMVAGAATAEVATASLESAVLKWFHGEDAPSQSCAAQLSYRLDHPDFSVPPACLRADPVYQQLDINEALLADQSLLDISIGEAQAIIDDLNKHFSNDNVVFRCVAADRWYCELPKRLSVQTWSPAAATGRSVSLTMVRGPDAGVWRGWLSEIEMLLHNHPVNLQRTAGGKTPINSLWLWGEGDLPPVLSSSAGRATVYSAHHYTRSLAAYHSVACQPVDAFSADAAGAGVLVVENALFSAVATGDADRYKTALAALESSVFEVLERTDRGDLARTVVIWGGDDHWLRCTVPTVSRGWLSGLLNLPRKLLTRGSAGND